MNKLHFGIILALSLIFSCKKTASVGEIKPVRKDLVEYVFATGILDPDQKYNLVAQAEGYLSSVNFKENDVIRQGQILAVIDNKSIEINTQSASEQLQIADFNLSDNAPALQQLQTNIDFAQKKYEQDMVQVQRYKKLWESNSIAKVEYENVALAAENSLSNLNALKQQYEGIKVQAKQQKITQQNAYRVNKTSEDFNKLKALVGGTVLKRYKQAGDYVRKGDVIAVIGNTNSIVAKINVDEGNIAKVKLGQKVWISLNTQKGKPYEGVLNEILPMFDENSQSFLCKVLFSAPLEFSISGTQLEANIEIGEKKNALVIPRKYMGFGNKVNVKGQKETSTIQAGIISSEYVEVLSGISDSTILLPLKP